MKEIRTAELQTATDELLTLEGMAIVFDTPTKIKDPAGEYTEIIENGALDGADLTDSHLFYNHDLNRVPLARTPKTMQFDVSTAGLRLSAQLPDTPEARAVYTAVKRGDLTGMSFGFKVPQGGDTWDAKTNTRTIHRIEKVYEVSVVPYPAYPTTSVEARDALKATQQHYKALQNARLLCNQILAKY